MKVSDVILHGFHAATACSLVHRNSVPSIQMRCRITANRRASATIAFLWGRFRCDLGAALRSSRPMFANTCDVKSHDGAAVGAHVVFGVILGTGVGGGIV